VLKRWAGPLITTMIFAGVALILLLNLNLGAKTGKPKPSDPPKIVVGIEHPIGDPVQKNRIEVAAVWLPAGRDGRHGCWRR